MPAEIAQRLLDWYGAHGRRLPWRGARDPYRIWVSEIMLQQTQVETVKPYYQRWLKRFPTVRALARAPLHDVLALWEGLGYYSRARNLHRAAQTVVAEHGGRLPQTVEGLRRLPGIGPYTAAAIASIAFGVDAAVLDGNVKRVLARVFDYTGDVKSPRGEKDLWALAEGLVPAGQAGDYNQAVMDLGATLCTPRAPACLLCPLLGLCQAQRQGLQDARPVARRRAPVPHRTLAVGVVRKRGRVLIVQRPTDALLGGLWAFPSAIGNGRPNAADLAQQLRRALLKDYGLRVRVGPQAHTVRHAYTHFQVTAHAYECLWLAGQPAPGGPRVRVKWAHIAGLADHPMGKVDRQIARTLQADRRS